MEKNLRLKLEPVATPVFLASGCATPFIPWAWRALCSGAIIKSISANFVFDLGAKKW